MLGWGLLFGGELNQPMFTLEVTSVCDVTSV